MKHPESTYRLRQNLPKTERLCSEKIIARLFQSGVFVSKYPLRVNAVVDELRKRAEVAVENEFQDGTEDAVLNELLVETEVVNELQEETGSQYEAGVKVLFSASKRRFPRAVDRNRVKRLLREVYRKHKQDLWDWAITNEKQVSIAMIFTGKEIVGYQQIEQLWKDLQVRLIKKLSLPEDATPIKPLT